MLIICIQTSLVAQLVKKPPAIPETPVQFLSLEYPLEKGQATSPVYLDFPCGSAGKESTCNAGDVGSIPGLGRSPGEEKGYPLQYSGMENSTDCIVHGDHIFADSSSRLKYYRLFNTDSSTSTKTERNMRGERGRTGERERENRREREREGKSERKGGRSNEEGTEERTG